MSTVSLPDSDLDDDGRSQQSMPTDNDSSDDDGSSDAEFDELQSIIEKEAMERYEAENKSDSEFDELQSIIEKEAMERCEAENKSDSEFDELQSIIEKEAMERYEAENKSDSEFDELQSIIEKEAMERYEAENKSDPEFDEMRSAIEIEAIEAFSAENDSDSDYYKKPETLNDKNMRGLSAEKNNFRSTEDSRSISAPEVNPSNEEDSYCKSGADSVLEMKRCISKLDSVKIDPDPEDGSTNVEQTIFEKCTLKTILGSGSFGVVWKVIEFPDNFDTALKITAMDEESHKEQDRELNISSALSHPNLVKVHSATVFKVNYTEMGKLFQGEATLHCHSLMENLWKQIPFKGIAIKMELCGENLRHWLRQDALHPHLKTTKNYQLAIINDLVKGTAYLHSKMIIHRDLKPENLMFSGESGYQLPLKIGDYGNCRVIKENQESELTSSIGTEVYRAPESLGNRYSFQSDLFSAGLIIWEVLQLLPQRSLRSYFDKLVNDKEEIHVNPPKLMASVDFESLIINMTRKRVAERVQDIVSVLQILEIELEG